MKRWVLSYLTKERCRKIKKAWKSIKRNYYGKVVKYQQKEQNKLDDRKEKSISKFYKNGGDYISAVSNGGFHERPDIIIRTGAVNL